MPITPEFEALWKSVDKFEVPKGTVPMCRYAKKFKEWADTLVEAPGQPRLVTVAQHKLLLTDRFFEFRKYVPREHRNHVGPRGHRCIFHVFEQTYEKLKVIELSLTPPLLFLPPPPPPPPQIAGIFLGGLEDQPP